jgi:hypothetical protein
MRSRFLVSSAVVAAVTILSCRSQPSRAIPFPTQHPRYAELARCAQTIGLAEGFHVSTKSQTLLERPVGDITEQIQELLWLGLEEEDDIVRAVAHVQRTSDQRRSTSVQLSSAAVRTVERIKDECWAPR